jgi:CHAT domain-containing protein
VLVNEDGAEALALCEEADALIDIRAQPVIAATNQKFKAQAHLKLRQWEDLLKAADTAYSLLDPILYSDMRRTVMQLAAEGLVTAGQFVRATGYLQRAVDAGERTLEQATSRAGRLERIFDLHDSYARLGYCFFQANEIAKGIEALDRGKGRLWRPAKSFAAFAQIKALVPEGGALLFAAFAPNDGAVAVVTANGERVCPLNGFGREHLTELLLGDVRNPASGSWISRYVFRNSNPQNWLDAIDAIGPVLFENLWVPVMRTLSTLGIQEGAELVWFPQAGLGVLPLHAAWKRDGEKRAWISETYAIRYAPSASSLLAGNARTANPRSLIVADPTGDLANSALEVHWAREAGEMTVLAGSDAAKETVMAELSRATLAHFSTHAVFRVDDPFKSSLLMAGGEVLSLEELLPLLQTSPLREVILSGCETAMAQVARRPDELLGFPAAFLEHGAATVVATQWPVDDWAAAALMGRFYRERPAKTAGQAMRAAQNWLREVMAGELSELLRPLKREPGPVGEAAAEIRTSLAGLDPAARPFAHPYFWAGFTVSGGG